MTKQKSTKITSTVAKTQDQTIQINFTIPFEDIRNAREKAADELGKNVEIPGFRKGKAPTDKVMDHVSQNALLEKTLSFILPGLLSDAIKEHKIAPAIYPRFELIKATDGEDWQVRAVTCEIPQIQLGDYRKIISGEIRSKSIWTPGKDKDKKPTTEQIQQEIIKVLINNFKITIPKVLIEEEVNNKLSGLLEKLEKLGLSLDGYLSSINKTANQLRQDYEKQSQEQLSLDLILNEIAIKEDIKVEKDEIDAAINASSADKTLGANLDNPQQRRVIESIFKRRKALDFLTSLF